MSNDTFKFQIFPIKKSCICNASVFRMGKTIIKIILTTIIIVIIVVATAINLVEIQGTVSLCVL